jgi:hypothetical protein
MSILPKQIQSYSEPEDATLSPEKRKALHSLVKGGVGLFFWQQQRQEAAILSLTELDLSEEEQKFLINRLKPIFQERLRKRKFLVAGRWFFRWLLPGLMLGIPLYILSSLDLIELSSRKDETEGMLEVLIFAIPILGFPITTIVSLYWDRYKVNSLCPMIEVLGNIDSTEFIPLLTDALPYPSLKEAATQALTSVLNKAQARQRGLDGIALQPLTHVLPFANEPLTVLILDNVMRVGHLQSISAIRHLTTKGKTPLIQNRAQEVLAHLLMLSTVEEERRSLLRASSESELENTLLRPSYATEAEPIEQLLRASNSTQH